MQGKALSRGALDPAAASPNGIFGLRAFDDNYIWMVRSGSPVDLGLWAGFIDRRTLIMPLDTHVLAQSVRLGLLTSGTASMSAARRLSDTLATIFPDDPLRGDFALFGYGVTRQDLPAVISTERSE